jgi:hypothetical protein
LFNLLACRLTEFVCFDGQFLGNLTPAKDLQSIEFAADQSFLPQKLLIDLGPSVENFQLIQINHGVLRFKGGVIKASFWQTSNQWHLAALKAKSNTAPGSSFLALMALPTGFAVTGTLATAKALDPVLRTRARLQII